MVIVLPGVAGDKGESRPRRSGSRSREPRGGAGAGAFGVDLAAAGRSGRHEAVEQFVRGRGNVRDGAIEGSLVRFRRHRTPAEFPDELQRGGADFLIGRRGSDVVERSDASAHGKTPSDT